MKGSGSSVKVSKRPRKGSKGTGSKGTSVVLQSQRQADSRRLPNRCSAGETVLMSTMWEGVVTAGMYDQLNFIEGGDARGDCEHEPSSPFRPHPAPSHCCSASMSRGQKECLGVSSQVDSRGGPWR